MGYSYGQKSSARTISAHFSFKPPFSVHILWIFDFITLWLKNQKSKNMDISLLEIKNAKSLMIEREWLAGMIPTAQLILSGSLRADKTEKRISARVTMAESGNVFLMSESDNENHGTQVESNEAYLNVIYVEGLVTRNGGACTYGSKQMRNLIMQASNDDDCKGHVIVLDTPGGLSTAAPDFKMAIDYAHERGLLVDGVIDGMCCSMGIYIGSMCDHLYYTSPSDRVGSVGVFSIIDVMKNGDVDPTTGEKHFEIYDPESYDKNDWYRQLSEEGKQDLIIENLKKDGKEFRDYVKSRRPGCTDEQLHGKVYKCSEVEGSFVDGQRTMQEVFQEVMAHYYETHKSSINNTDKIMKVKYPKLFAALQVEEMQMQEGGAFMNEGLLANLNAAIEAQEKATADAQALVESLNQEKANLTQQVADLNAQIETLNTEHTAALTEKDNQITALQQEKESLMNDSEGKSGQIDKLNADLDRVNESLTTAQNTIVERDQQITDLNAQIEELQKGAGEAPAAGASPQNNGAGAEVVEVAVSTQYVYDPSKPYDENMRLKKEWEESHK